MTTDGASELLEYHHTRPDSPVLHGSSTDKYILGPRGVEELGVPFGCCAAIATMKTVDSEALSII
jgi:hypothetical protein